MASGNRADRQTVTVTGLLLQLTGDSQQLTEHETKDFKTYELAKQFHKDCQKLKLRAPYKDQFDRALLSIVLNLVEGSAKPTRKDRRKFYAIAMGSLRETQAILDLCNLRESLQQSDAVAACLYRLIQNPGGSP